FRMPFTMASDATWYRANRIFAIALIVAGVIWLLLQWLVPLAFPSQPAAPRWADGLGWTVLGVAVILAVLKYRRPVA
ncbi:MAG: SdpI family protein, partial [Vicinamibacterales bacterium]